MTAPGKTRAGHAKTRAAAAKARTGAAKTGTAGTVVARTKDVATTDPFTLWLEDGRKLGTSYARFKFALGD
jgi:hypothetical protein